MNVWGCCHKSLNLLARMPFARGMFRTTAMRRIRENIELQYVLGLPDRRHFERTIIPHLRDAAPGCVLFVGCAWYTAHYVELFESAGIDLRTIDCMPENAKYGAPGRHVVGDILQAEQWFNDRQFDVVLLNGVFGYGLNDCRQMNRAFGVLRRLLKPQGFLLVGWNRGLVPDPLEMEACERLFHHVAAFGLPQRQSFKERTHVYDWFAVRS